MKSETPLVDKMFGHTYKTECEFNLYSFTTRETTIYFNSRIEFEKYLKNEE